MAIRVVVDHPGAGLRRLGRGIVGLLGVVFVTAGLVAAVFPLLFIVFLATTLASGDDLGLSDGDMPVLLASAGIAVVALFIGLRLIRGRRRMVLFLRRFGLTEATAVVTAAVSSAPGRSWRVITLDDGDVAPIGSAKSSRRLSGLGVVFGLAVVGTVLWWLLGGGFDQFLEGVADTASGDPEGVEEIIGSLFAVLIAVAVVGALVLIALMILAAFFGGLALLSLGSYRAGRRGERAKQATMETAGDIERVARAASRNTRRTLGPRLVVVRVASAIWQRAVYELASRASIVIVDVSQPTGNLVWEIESLRPSSGPRWVFIAHRPRLAALTSAHQPTGSPAARVLAAIDGCDVIAYDTDRTSIRRFSRAIGGALAQGGHPRVAVPAAGQPVP